VIKQRHINDDDDLFDENGILKDGRALRVSMMMDSMSPLQRAIATDPEMRCARDAITTDAPAVVTDAFGDSGLALHKPGSRYLSAGHGTVDHALQTTLRVMRDEAYRDGVADYAGRIRQKST
jgi:hypothetical protein